MNCFGMCVLGHGSWFSLEVMKKLKSFFKAVLNLQNCVPKLVLYWQGQSSSSFYFIQQSLFAVTLAILRKFVFCLMSRNEEQQDIFSFAQICFVVSTKTSSVVYLSDEKSFYPKQFVQWKTPTRNQLLQKVVKQRKIKSKQISSKAHPEFILEPWFFKD